jgi:hypothetical protein
MDSESISDFFEEMLQSSKIILLMFLFSRMIFEISPILFESTVTSEIFNVETVLFKSKQLRIFPLFLKKKTGKVKLKLESNKKIRINKFWLKTN